MGMGGFWDGGGGSQEGFCDADPQTNWRIFVFHASLISSISTAKMPFVKKHY